MSEAWNTAYHHCATCDGDETLCRHEGFGVWRCNVCGNVAYLGDDFAPAEAGEPKQEADYVARMFVVQIVNIKGQVVKEQCVPAFTHEHAAQIVWNGAPDDGTPADVWEDAKRGMAKVRSGFVKVREASSVE